MNPKLASYSLCTGCGACAASCVKDAIVMEYDKNGHLMPFVDKGKCINCGMCVKKCPVCHPENVAYHDSCQLDDLEEMNGIPSYEGTIKGDAVETSFEDNESINFITYKEVEDEGTKLI